MDAIERVEVSIRTRLSYVLSHTYGPHAHLRKQVFFNPDKHNRTIEKINNEVRSSGEIYVKHFKETYSETSPPIWATVELLSLGQVSAICNNLKNRKDKISIAGEFGLEWSQFRSFLHHLSHVRNVCAHHARLWNRVFTITTNLPKSKPSILVGCINEQQNRKIYSTICWTLYFLDQISPNHQWRDRIKKLVNEHKIDTRLMGFPHKYENLKIWK